MLPGRLHKTVDNRREVHRDCPLGCDILPFYLGTQGPPEHCLGSDWDLWLWTHVCLHQPVIRPSWISQGSDLQRRVLRGSLNWLDLAGCWESKKSMRGITIERLSRDQALSLCSGSTDSKTPDCQRTNPRRHQIVRNHTKETTVIQDPASPNHQ